MIRTNALIAIFAALGGIFMARTSFAAEPFVSFALVLPASCRGTLLPCPMRAEVTTAILPYWRANSAAQITRAGYLPAFRRSIR